MQYSSASISLFLFSSLAVSTPVAGPDDPQTTASAGFNLFEQSYNCEVTTTSTAAPRSNVDFCFNLDSTAQSGSFNWPPDPSYQAIFYIAPDCEMNKQEKQRNITTYTYTPTGILGDESKNTGVPENCFGPIWQQPGEGSVWMSPKSVKPPGGWPAVPT